MKNQLIMNSHCQVREANKKTGSIFFRKELFSLPSKQQLQMSKWQTLNGYYCSYFSSLPTRLESSFQVITNFSLVFAYAKNIMTIKKPFIFVY